jgi:hypothetical protein
VPNDIWSIVIIASLSVWIASTMGFIFRAFPARGQFEARLALKWGVAVVVSFAVWIVGLLNA